MASAGGRLKSVAIMDMPDAVDGVHVVHAPSDEGIDLCNGVVGNAVDGVYVYLWRMIISVEVCRVEGLATLRSAEVMLMARHD